jgi:hypothetical protein
MVNAIRTTSGDSIKKLFVGLMIISLTSAAFAYEACDTDLIENAPSGYTCSVGGSVWRVESPVVKSTILGSNRYRTSGTFLNLNTGIKVLKREGTNYRLDVNEHDCERFGYVLPSGYPENLNGKLGMPNEDSDFVKLEKHHIRDVIPGIKPRSWDVPGPDSDLYYLSSTPANHPVYHYYYAYTWNGEITYEEYYRSDYTHAGMLCILKPNP